MKRRTLSVKEAAEYLGVSEWLIYDMVRLKQIPTIRVRTRIFFRIETLNQWMSDLEAASYKNEGEVV